MFSLCAGTEPLTVGLTVLGVTDEVVDVASIYRLT